MRYLVLGLVLVCPVLGQTPSVADRVAQQNTLFEEVYQTQERVEAWIKAQTD